MQAEQRIARLEDVTAAQDLLEALPIHAAILDANGVIVAVNGRWERFAEMNGLAADRCGRGESYLAVCESAAREGDRDASAVHAGLAEVLAGRRKIFEFEYACHSPDARRWFSMTATPLVGAGGRGAIVRHVDVTARHLAEEAVAENLSLQRTAQRIAGISPWQLETDSRRVKLAGEAHAILGIRTDQVATFDQLLSFVHERDQARFENAIEELLASHDPLDTELRIRRCDGSIRWVRLRGELHPHAGSAPRVVGTLMDITERRRAGEALRSSEKRYRRQSRELSAIVDSSPDIICSIDRRGRFVRVGGACRRILGFQPQDLMGRSIMAIVAASDHESVAGLVRHLRAGVERHAVELQAVHKDGGLVSLSCALRWSPEDRRLYCVARDETERLLIAEANRQLSERLRLTLEHMTEGFFTLDASLRFTYLNASLERLVGRGREELLGVPLPEAFPAPEARPFIEHYRRTLASGEPVEFLEEFRPLGLWLEVRAFRTQDGLAVHLRDVTERRKAGEALRESEERYRHIAEATADAVWDWNIVTGEDWWSEGMDRLFGLGHGPNKFERWVQAIHPEDRRRVEGAIHAALRRDDRLWAQRYRLRKADGTDAHVLDRGYIVRDAAGRAVRMVGGLVDLTEQIEAENRLAEQARLLDAASDAISVRDLDHRILYWNQGAERAYGWTRDEVLGRDAREVLFAYGDGFLRAQEAVLRDGSFAGELEVRARDGQHVTVEARWTLVRGSGGQPDRVLSISTDVTHRRELERQLISMQRLESIGRLAGGIAHDLNNVLTPIMMSANLLQRPEMAAEDASLVQAIAHSAKRGSDMVSQLLSFTRGMEGRHVAFELGDVVREVEKILAETFPRDIEIEARVAAGPLVVRGDPTQMHQVLVNLCVNARDAMADGGKLVIAVARAGTERLRIAVSDTGTGMTPEVREKIFDPFFTTKEPGKGTGLGLPTTLAIVRRHGGSIDVASTPGAGTVFTIELPACEEAAEAPRPAGEQRPRGQGQMVLVVDDEAPVRVAAERALRAYGYHVLGASDGAEALALFAKMRHVVDVVLIDMMMPVMDGPAAIPALLRIKPGVRVVASSGISDDEKVAAARQAGARRFLAKPYTTDALLVTLRDVLREG